MSSSDETPDQILLRLSRQMEEVGRSITDLMGRQSTMDEQLSSLLLQSASAGPPRTNGAASHSYPSDHGASGRNDLLRSTGEPGWKAVRYRKIYLETIPLYEGKSSGWTNFITKLRLTLDQSYEWAPVFLRMSEMLETPPVKDELISWIESTAIGYDRSDLIEFGKDLWCILVNRTSPGSGPAAAINRVMETETGWMRGPIALYELQRERV